MAVETEVIARFKADTTDLNRKMTGVKQDIAGVEKAAGGTAGGLGVLGKGFAALGGAMAGMMAAGAVVDFFKDSMQAAMEEEQSMRSLAVAMTNLGAASQIDGAEAGIAKLSKMNAIADDDLRPAFQRLFTATGDVATANKGLQLAMDIAAGTGKDLQTVTLALSKGYSGSTTSLGRLGAGLDAATLKSGDMNAITAELSTKFGGQAAAAADTYAGKMKSVNIAVDEAKETIGFALLGAIESATGAFAGSGGMVEAIEMAAQKLAYFITGLGEAVSGLNEFLSSTAQLVTGNEEASLSFADVAYNAAMVLPGVMPMVQGFGWIADKGKEVSDANAQAANSFNTVSGSMSWIEQTAIRAAVAFQRNGNTQVKAAEDAEAALEALKAAYDAWDARLAASQNMDDFKKSLHDLDETLKGNKRSFAGMGDAAKENRDTLREALGNAATIAKNWGAETGASSEEVNAKYKSLRKDIIDGFVKQGFTRKEIKAFMGEEGIWTSPAKDAMTSAKEAGVAAAKPSGSAVGSTWSSGVASGMSANEWAVIREAISIVKAAEAAARAEARSHSPSLLFAEVGADLVRGVEVGMRSRQPAVTNLSMTIGRDVVAAYAKGMASEDESVREAARKTMMDAVREAYQAGLSDLQDKLNQAKSYAMGWRSQMLSLLNMGSAFSQAQNKDAAAAAANDQLADATQRLAEAQANLAKADTDSSRQSAQRAVESAQQVYNVAAAAAQSAATAAAGNWIDEFKKQMSDARNFMDLLARLKASGAHEMLIQQIAAAGPEAGSAMAQDLLGDAAAGGGLIGEFNTGFTEFDQQATALGVDFANAWGNATGPKMGGLAAAEAVKAFRAEFGPGGPGREKLLRMMDRLAADMDRVATITVTTVHRTVYESSGTPGRRAMGGPVNAGQAYIVGERGMELFVPNVPGNIIPNKDLGGNAPPMRLPGGGSASESTSAPQNVTIQKGAVQMNFTGSADNLSKDEISAVVDDALLKLAREIRRS